LEGRQVTPLKQMLKECFEFTEASDQVSISVADFYYGVEFTHVRSTLRERPHKRRP